jgi:adenylyl-sulfate kinase
MKMLSASRARRCGRTWDFTGADGIIAGRRRSAGRFRRRSAGDVRGAILTPEARPTPPAGIVAFLTGLSGAGKSTIADALAAELRAAGEPVSVLDGDELRKHLSADLGFDRASREANVQRAAEIAAERAGAGEIVVTALISPFDRSRRLARELVERRAPFLLVWVRTPLEVAEARDPKGLYAKARAGAIPDFTGIDSPYEEPEDADLVIETISTPVPDAVAQIREAIDRKRSTAPRRPADSIDAEPADDEEPDPLT